MLLRAALVATIAALVIAQSTSPAAQPEADTTATAIADATADATANAEPTDAPTTATPIRDVPSERPVFKMDNNKINLKAQGFNVTTPESSIILANGEAAISSPSISLNAESMQLKSDSTTMLGSTTTNVMTNSKTGVTLTASADVDIEATDSATIMADRVLSVKAQNFNSRTPTGTTSLDAKSALGITANTVSASGSNVVASSGTSKMGIEAATAILDSGSITVKAAGAFSVTSAKVTVGSTGNSVVVDSNGATVASNSKITFKTAKRTITLEDLMTKLDTLNSKVGGLETDLSGTEKAVSESISTSETAMEQLDQDATGLSSAISTQASTLDASAASLATALDSSDTDLVEDLDAAFVSLEANIESMDEALTSAGVQRDVVSGVVSTSRATLNTKLNDIKSVLMDDIDDASPDSLSTSVSTAISTLEKAVNDAQTSYAGRLTTSRNDVAGLTSKITNAHNTLTVAKTNLQQADLSLGERVDKAGQALADLAGSVAAANTAANAANAMITSVSNAAKNVARPPNAAMVAALSKPVKQMVSDTRVLKNYITGEVGSFRAAATFKPFVHTSSDYYGGNCAFWDDVATCGNWYVYPGAVDVYVIGSNKVTRTAHIRPASTLGPYTYGYFGNSVAINSKWLVVGAYNDYVSKTNRLYGGRIYVYAMGSSKGSVNTAIVHQLTHPSPRSGDYCGRTVAVSGDMVAFACPYDESVTSRVNHGTVIVQQYDSVAKKFVQMAVAVHENPANYHYLGMPTQSYYQRTLEMAKDMVIAGAPRMNAPSTYTGAVVIFVKDGNKFEEKQRLTPATTTYAYCGDSVMMRGDYLIVSCPQKDVNNQRYAGTVEVYKYNAAKRSTGPFEHVQTLTTSTIISYRYTGRGIGMNDEGTRISFSNRGTNYMGMVVFYKLVNDKFVYESTMEGTTAYNYFGESSQYPGTSYVIAGSIWDDSVASNAGTLDMLQATFPEISA